jgi:hypothetical protein
MTMMFFSFAGGVLGVPVALQIVPGGKSVPLLDELEELLVEELEALVEELEALVEELEALVDELVVLPVDVEVEVLEELVDAPALWPPPDEPDDAVLPLVLLPPVPLPVACVPEPPHATSEWAISGIATKQERGTRGESFMRISFGGVVREAHSSKCSSWKSTRGSASEASAAVALERARRPL